MINMLKLGLLFELIFGSLPLQCIYKQKIKVKYYLLS